MPTRTAGFTLLELLAALVIITVLLGLALPALDNVRTRDLGATAQRLCLMLNHARQEAVLSSRPWRVVISPATRAFSFEQRVGAEFIPVNAPPFADIRLPADLSLTDLTVNGAPVAGGAQIYLLPSGAQDAFSLTLNHEQRRQRLSMGPLGPATTEHDAH